MGYNGSPEKAVDAATNSACGTSSTHWTVVFAAGQGDRDAFGKLYVAYLPSLLVYLRYTGNMHDAAMDLLHGFFEHLLENESLGKVEKRGKFRSWLLASLKHFVRDVRDKRITLKRGGDRPHLPVGSDVDLGEVEPVDARLTPEQAYDRKWAIFLLKRVLSKLETEFVRDGKQQLFVELKDFLPGGNAASRYEEIGARLGGVKPNTIAVALDRLRERYKQLLQREISDTVGSDMVEEEWRHLLEAVSGRTDTNSGDSKP